MIENSEFDNNEDGFDTNSQNGDNPPPQNGACPNNGISPITHTHSCWVFMHNYVHDNNNPNVPAAGLGRGRPGRHRDVDLGRPQRHGHGQPLRRNNGAWGDDLRALPRQRAAVHRRHDELRSAGHCLYDEWGDALLGNTFTNNGFFGNPTNGDFAALNLETGIRPTASAATRTPAAAA